MSSKSFIYRDCQVEVVSSINTEPNECTTQFVLLNGVYMPGSYSYDTLQYCARSILYTNTRFYGVRLDSYDDIKAAIKVFNSFGVCIWVYEDKDGGIFVDPDSPEHAGSQPIGFAYIPEDIVVQMGMENARKLALETEIPRYLAKTTNTVTNITVKYNDTEILALTIRKTKFNQAIDIAKQTIYAYLANCD
jgi:hypothetical protein